MPQASWGLGGKESICQAEDTGSIPVIKDPLEKGMATHSSILAWEIPWTEEPAGIQSTGSQRVRHDLATKQQVPMTVTSSMMFNYSLTKLPKDCNRLKINI